MLSSRSPTGEGAEEVAGVEHLGCSAPRTDDAPTNPRTRKEDSAVDVQYMPERCTQGGGVYPGVSQREGPERYIPGVKWVPERVPGRLGYIPPGYPGRLYTPLYTSLTPQ